MPSVYAISDLHLEFRKDPSIIETFPKADILVLAGDICNAVTDEGQDIYRQFLLKAAEKYSDVVFIAGNHEFYGCRYDRNKVLDFLFDLAEETHTTFLHRTTAVIQGLKFVGATLWSLIDKESVSRINDFHETVFRTQIDYVEEFVNDFRFLRTVLERSVQRYPVVVVTHHLPSGSLIHSRYFGSVVNSAFSTDVLGSLSLSPQVKLWVSGHTHEFMRKKYGGCELFVNPLGYPHEMSSRSTSVSDHLFDFTPEDDAKEDVKVMVKLGHMYPSDPEKFISDLVADRVPCDIERVDLYDGPTVIVTPKTLDGFYDGRQTATGPCCLDDPRIQQKFAHCESSIKKL